MPRFETIEFGRRREDRQAVRFVWTAAGRVRRLTAQTEPCRAASRILEALARFEPAPRPISLLLK